MKKLIFIIILLSCFYSVLSSAISDGEPNLVKPHLHPTGCPSWKTISEHLDVSNVQTGSTPSIWARTKEHSFYVQIPADNFSTPYRWYFLLTNLTAASKEEALVKAKNILNTSADSSIQYKYSPSSDGSFYSSTCKFFDGEHEMEIAHSVACSNGYCPP